MSQSYPEAVVTTDTAGGPADARAQLQTLWHYLPDYDYRPDLFQYTEFYTTDPDYVVLDVGMMSPSGEHSAHLDQIGNALRILIARFCEPPIHVSREVGISQIRGRIFASERHTHTLAPDLAVWARPLPPHPHPSYQYGRDGGPRLVVEVVSHSGAAMRANDLDHKWRAYARMGIGEYWLLDTQQESPLIGYTLDGAPPPQTEYRRIEVAPDAGQASRVLGTSLRWVADTLECWYAAWGRWVPVVEIPVLEERIQTEARVALGARLDLLLAMGVPLDLSRELGLDLLCMDTLPGIGSLMLTQGDLGQLRRHIPPRPPGRATEAAHHYVTELLGP